jgi:hypothetical protein
MYIGLFITGLISFLQVTLFAPRGATINPFNKKWWTEKIEKYSFISDRKVDGTMFEDYVICNIVFWILVGLIISVVQ